MSIVKHIVRTLGRKYNLSTDDEDTLIEFGVTMYTGLPVVVITRILEQATIRFIVGD